VESRKPKRRGPSLSTSSPIGIEKTAWTSVAIVSPMVTCVRDQPKDRLIG